MKQLISFNDASFFYMFITN